MPDVTLIDHQFEVGGVAFGVGCPVEVEHWTPAAAAWRSQDKARPRQHGTRPGRDLRGSATWAFDAFVNGEEGPGALAGLSDLAAVWPAEEVAATPGLLVPLRYAVGGRTRRVLGRPREFDAPIDTRYLGGMIPVTMNFVVMDPLYYDDREELVEIDGVPETTGGLRSPLIGRPGLRSVYTANAQQKAAVVGGTRPTWATVIFTGNLINPWLEIRGSYAPWPKWSGWKVQAMASMGGVENDTVVLDGRPESRAATRNGVAVEVSRDTRIATMQLPPGRHTIHFGSDGGGSGKAQVRWRSANHSL